MTISIDEILKFWFYLSRSPSSLTSAIRKLHMRGRYRRCARFFKNRCIEVSDHPPRFHAEAAGHELNLVRSLSPTSTLSKDLYRGESHQPPPHDTNGSKLIKVFLISRAASGKSSATLQGIPGCCSPGVMSDMNNTIILQQPSAGVQTIRERSTMLIADQTSV